MKLSNLVCSALAGLAIGAAGISNVYAHDDKHLDSIKSPNGGQTRMAGVYHFELVLAQKSKIAKENAVAVYVTDHASKGISTKGASATLTLVQGAKKSTIELVPEGDNRLVGKATYASTANLKGALTVTMAGKPAEQARFTPFASVKKSSVKPVNKETEHAHEHQH